jgi:hypothetical protein
MADVHPLWSDGMSVLLFAAATLASYNCEIETPRAVSVGGGAMTVSEIGLPPMALRFTVEIRSGNPAKARVNWPGDPMAIQGEFPVLQTAPGSYAFSAVSGGNCLFTEEACLAQVNLVARGDGTATVLITPVALASDKEKGTREAFAVVAAGRCASMDSKR